MRVLQESLDAALRRQGLGRVEGLLGDEHPPRALRGEWHQMGTTRMATDPRQGVVDADCRVHGLSNLYVAGASVFPTVGYANPTLTIVALSYRLAAHLKRELESLPSLGPIW
jgi:choline dehydrogenase-like flavoprotein